MTLISVTGSNGDGLYATEPSVTEAELTFDNLTLFEALKSAGQKHGLNELILEDSLGEKQSYKQLLMRARLLGKRFSNVTGKGQAVAVLLPNSNAVVATFFGLQSAGLIPAMLNYTAGPTIVVSACKTVKAEWVISSRAFITKADLQPIVESLEKAGLKFIWLEDIRKSVNWYEKLITAIFYKKPITETHPDEPALILFTSGSEGLPKAVVLSHKNILINCAQVTQTIRFDSSDKLFNVLPVFHSFGMTGGMVLPLVSGVKLYLYPSPLHFKIIPQAVAKSKPTILFGTDTFLTGYSRTAKDEQFSSLRMVVAGAEAVKEETRKIWKERFDTIVLEGFGMTEASPVVAVNAIRANKAGSVGRLLPGIEHRLVAVEGIKKGGRLWLKGPNIMLGYMKYDAPGILQKPENGWHDSGDIVEIDEEGFVFIKGRAKRFAKIAGEMVSLSGIESIINSIWTDHDHAVVKIPDKRRGEKIILLTTNFTGTKDEIIKAIKKRGFPEIMVPSKLLAIDTIPLLGTGKVDYTSAQKIAQAEE